MISIQKKDMALEIYVGPMYAGKTTKMINMFQKDSDDSKIAIDYNTANGFNQSVMIATLHSHDDVGLQGVYQTKTLMNLWNDIAYENRDSIHYVHACTAKKIYINECQFFPDLKEFVLNCLQQELHVFLYGLDGDFKQELFGQTMMLIPYCSHLEKIQGVCKTCNNPSVISYRTSNDKQLYLPNSECYIPLCLKCHKEIQ